MTKQIYRYIFLTGIGLVLLLIPRQGRAVADTLIAWQYYEQGETFMGAEQMDSAIHYFGLAQSIYDDLDSLEYYVSATSAIAVCHYQLGELSEAGKALEAAEVRLGKSKHSSPYHYRGIYDLLGPVYEALGDLDRALDISLKSLDMDAEESDPKYKANRLNNIGAIYFSKGDYHQAEDYYQAAYDHFGESSDVESQARAMVNLGLAQMRQNRFKKAEETLDDALDMIRYSPSPKNDRTAILGRNHLALCNIELGFPKLARLQLQLNMIGYDLTKGDEAIVRANMGFADAEMKDHESAVAELTKAIELAEGELSPNKIATMQLHLADVTSNGPDPSVAYQHYSKGIALLCEDAAIDPDILQEQPDPEGSPAAVRVRDKRTLFRLLAGRGRLALTHSENKAEGSSGASPINGHDPIQDFRDAFFIMDLMRADLITPDAKNFLATYVRRLNDDAMALFIQHHNHSEDIVDFGYEVLERRKALNLLESVLISWQATMGEKTRKQLEEARKLQTSLAIYERSLFTAEEEGDKEATDRFRTYVLDLREKLRVLADPGKENSILRDYRRQIMSLDNLREYSKSQNTWVVEFGLADTMLVAICSGPDTVRTRFFSGQNALDSLRSQARTFAQMVSDWESALAGGSEPLNILSQTGWSLYQSLLAELLPEEDELPLVIIPDGILNFVPFEALLDQQPPAGTGFSGLPYLIHQRAISYGFSGTLLSGLSEKETSKETEPTCLAFAPGGASTGSAEEPLGVLRDSEVDLPGARREVKALAESFEGSYFLGSYATEEAFIDSVQNNSYQMIHLAMHGIVDPKQSAYSYLAFQRTDTSDGRLQDFEIRQLDFSQTDMVVLSACETGLGEYVDGEGVISLGRSFVQGGAGSVVMSLWKLEDGASSELMEYFYKNLKEGRSRKDALREAKISYLEGADDLHAHPAFWAGYILLGDTEALTEPSQGFPWWIAGVAAILVILLGMMVIARRRKRSSQT